LVLKIGDIRKIIAKYLVELKIRDIYLQTRKGYSYLSTGYVYAPYVPLMVSPIMVFPILVSSTKAKPDAPMTVGEARRLIAAVMEYRDSNAQFTKGVHLKNQYTQKTL